MSIDNKFKKNQSILKKILFIEDHYINTKYLWLLFFELYQKKKKKIDFVEIQIYIKIPVFPYFFFIFILRIKNKNFTCLNHLSHVSNRTIS